MESPLDQAPIDTEALRRLHYAAAIACGVFATLVIHILLTVFGLGLDSALRSTDPRQQFISAIAWWAIAAAGFVGGWASAAYLIAAARERDLIYKLAQWFLIALVFVIATVGGIMLIEKTEKEILAFEISDEALEIAAAKEKAGFTLGACTGLSVCDG